MAFCAEQQIQYKLNRDKNHYNADLNLKIKMCSKTYKIGEPIVNGIDVVIMVFLNKFAELSTDIVNIVTYMCV